MSTEPRAREIIAFGLTSADAVRLAEFYRSAFGARHSSSARLGGTTFENLMKVDGGAVRHSLRLGSEQIDIVQFDTPGTPYPRTISPFDTSFQHFAIVVSDMELAMANLKRVRGWAPVSSDGPQHLPVGVTAFKFQDPEGHPLELLAFPAGGVPARWRERPNKALFLGIDHSAISVRRSEISCAFYRNLGFKVTGETHNRGLEQALLDGVPSPDLEITSLSLAQSAPHLELLCYRSEARPPPQHLANNDVAATRVLLAVEQHDEAGVEATSLIIDPDGHRLLLVPHS